MKKRTLGLIGCMLFASLALGFAVGMTVNKAYNNQIVAVYAEGEQAEQEAENASSEEEASKWKELYEESLKKFDELKNKQVAGTTIGAIVGSIVGAIVSFIPAMLNRSNIHTAIDNLGVARRDVSALHETLATVRDEFKINNENLDKAIKSVNMLEKDLGLAQSMLEKVLADNEQLHKENALISAENKEIKDLLLAVFSQSTVLTALGISEDIFQKYLPKK